MTTTTEDKTEVVCAQCQEPLFCSCLVCEVCGEPIGPDDGGTPCECGTLACDRCITLVDTLNGSAYVCTPCADGDDHGWKATAST